MQLHNWHQCRKQQIHFTYPAVTIILSTTIAIAHHRAADHVAVVPVRRIFLLQRPQPCFVVGFELLLENLLAQIPQFPGGIAVKLQH